MTISVFIDGAAGTTGLDIAGRLAKRDDVRLITLGNGDRKDAGARAAAMRAADFAILCLPDAAAKAAVAMAGDSSVRIIDASTAHRVAAGWTYGFAEFAAGQATAIAAAARVSNPGCYATGFIAAIAPLIARGLLPADGHYSCNAVSGYSGGGNAMIARYEPEPAASGPAASNDEHAMIAWRGYALGIDHKHVPEMQVHCGLVHPPLFSPAVVPAFRGMVVDIPLSRAADPRIAPAPALRAALVDHYVGSAMVAVGGLGDAGEIVLRARAPASDRLTLDIFASADGAHIRLVAMLDNLGKGAGGACVHNLNIMAGLPQIAGLRL